MITNIHSRKAPVNFAEEEGINFVDGWGRFHQKPTSRSKPYPGNNAFLFSGYANLLGILPNPQLVLLCWYKCLTSFGFDRHPNNDAFPASSHDEVVGVFMIGNRDSNRAVYKWSEDRNFTICNFATYQPKPWWKMNPFKVVRDFWRLSREKDPRNSTYKYPYIWPIVFKHAPEHIYFYQRCAGVRPGVYRTLRFYLASAFTYWFGGPSGRAMLGFKLLKIHQDRMLTPGEELMWNFFNKRTAAFKNDAAEYFLPYTDHPIVVALQEKIL